MSEDWFAGLVPRVLGKAADKFFGGSSKQTTNPLLAGFEQEQKKISFITQRQVATSKAEQFSKLGGVYDSPIKTRRAPDMRTIAKNRFLQVLAEVQRRNPSGTARIALASKAVARPVEGGSPIDDPETRELSAAAAIPRRA